MYMIQCYSLDLLIQLINRLAMIIQEKHQSCQKEHLIHLNSEQRRKSAKSWLKTAIIVLIIFVLAIVLRNNSKLIARVLMEQTLNMEAKEQYKEQLRRYFDDQMEFDGLKLAQSNFAYSPISTSAINQLQQQEYSRLNNQYHFDEISTELPFCLVVQRLNIQDGFSYEFTLNSIFNQNYSNYKIIILHEPQTRGYQMVQNYLKQNQIPNQKYIHIITKSPRSILRNIYEATHEHCSADSISLPIHRSGELIGRNVFKVYNVLYQINKVGLIYSDYYRYSRDHYLKEGTNIDFPEKQLKNIRREIIFITDAITYRTQYFLNIPKEELLGNGYTFYDIVYEQALIFPLVEMMCGIVFKIDGYYMLTKETFEDYNDFLDHVDLQKGLSEYFRNKVSVPCNETYTQQAKGSFYIKTLKNDHLRLLELAAISSESTQLNAIVKRAAQRSPFNGNPKKAEARIADKYIYNGRVPIAGYKRQYQLDRTDICELLPEGTLFKMTKYNLFLGNEIDEMYHSAMQKYDAVVEKDHRLSYYSKYQAPLCIVIAQLPSRVGQYRFEYLLNSVFSQDYSNYFVVINNRNPMLDQFVRKYLHHYQISKEKYAYVLHSPFSAPAETIYKSITEKCHPNSISMILSGKQELFGKKVFKVFSSKFRDNKYKLIYSSGFEFNQAKRKTTNSISTNYTDQEKSKILYRNSPKKYSNLVAFRTKMFRHIKVAHLQDEKGHFLSSNWEEAIYFPLLELSCSMNAQIEGNHYIRHQELADNEPYVYDVGIRIRSFKQYACFEETEEVSVVVTQILTNISSQRKQIGGVMHAIPSMNFNPLQKNAKGASIVDVLYGSQKKIRAKREQYQHQRQRAFEKMESNPGLELSMFNLKLDNDLVEVEQALVADDIKRAKSITGLQSKNEYPMCIVIQLAFVVTFQFQYTLNSLFLQNYSNYFAVIFGDGSEDGDELIRKYLDFYAIPVEKYVYLPNQKKSYGLETLANAQSYCSKDSIVLHLRDSDEFAGRNVLKLFSETYQKQSSLLIFSNYFYYQPQILQEMITLVQQKENSIRKADVFRLSFAAFPADLFKKIDVANFKNDDGEYFKEAVDKALYLPMIEMACARMSELQGAHFIRSMNKIPDDDLFYNQLKQITRKKSYHCLEKN